MALYFIAGCVIVALLATGIPIFFIFRGTSRDAKRALNQAMLLAGDAKIVIEGTGACLDPTSPKRSYGCLLLTDENIIYAGQGGGEIVIPRDTVAKVEVATPILGSDYHGDTLLLSYAGNSEVLRIRVDDCKRWMHVLGAQKPG
jgi:hypothetical protein